MIERENREIYRQSHDSQQSWDRGQQWGRTDGNAHNGWRDHDGWAATACWDHRDADRRDWGRDHNNGSWNQGRDHNGWNRAQNNGQGNGWNHGGSNARAGDNGSRNRGWNGGTMAARPAPADRYRGTGTANNGSGTTGTAGTTAARRVPARPGRAPATTGTGTTGTGTANNGSHSWGNHGGSTGTTAPARRRAPARPVARRRRPGGTRSWTGGRPARRAPAHDPGASFGRRRSFRWLQWGPQWRSSLSRRRSIQSAETRRLPHGVAGFRSGFAPIQSIRRFPRLVSECFQRLDRLVSAAKTAAVQEASWASGFWSPAAPASSARISASGCWRPATTCCASTTSSPAPRTTSPPASTIRISS